MTREELLWKLAEFPGWRLTHFEPGGELTGTTFGGEPVKVSAAYRAVRDLPNGTQAFQFSREAEELVRRVIQWEKINAVRPAPAAVGVTRGGMASSEHMRVRSSASAPASMDAPEGGVWSDNKTTDQPRDKAGRFTSKQGRKG